MKNKWGMMKKRLLLVLGSLLLAGLGVVLYLKLEGTGPAVSMEGLDAAVRAAHGIAPDERILLVLPGSRQGEVGRLAPIFGEALRPVLARHPGLRVVVPAALPVAGMLPDLLTKWPGDPVLLDPRGRREDDALAEKRAAFRAADMALAASGTVSLELAAAGTPMIIAYDMNWISRTLIARMLKIDTVTLVNIVTGSRAVPEFLGEACKPAPIAEALLVLLEDEGARQDQIAAGAETMRLLGQGGEAPGLRAARAVLDGLR
mgnify:CR=1 FL=1